MASRLSCGFSGSRSMRAAAARNASIRLSNACLGAGVSDGGLLGFEKLSGRLGHGRADPLCLIEIEQIGRLDIAFRRKMLGSFRARLRQREQQRKDRDDERSPAVFLLRLDRRLGGIVAHRLRPLSALVLPDLSRNRLRAGVNAPARAIARKVPAVGGASTRRPIEPRRSAPSRRRKGGRLRDRAGQSIRATQRRFRGTRRHARRSGRAGMQFRAAATSGPPSENRSQMTAHARSRPVNPAPRPLDDLRTRVIPLQRRSLARDRAIRTDSRSGSG